MANSREHILKFKVQLEMDPQALSKVDKEINDLIAERKKINRRVDSAKKTNALEENTKALNDAAERRLGLEKALGEIQQKNEVEETRRIKRKQLNDKIDLQATADKKKVEEDLAKTRARTTKEEEAARAKREQADKAELSRIREKIKLDQDLVRQAQRRASQTTQVAHYNKARQAANTLSGVTSVADMTPEQLKRAKDIWNQYASTVKKADEGLFNQINSNLKRLGERNKKFAALEKERIDLAKRVAKESSDISKKAAKDIEADINRRIKALHRQTKEEEKEYARQIKIQQKARGGNNRGILEIGSGATGRGILSGFAGMGGLNLYGLGVVGGAGALIKGSLSAYTEVFALKNVLSGIITTFNQFKDAAGKPVSKAENFNRSIDYTEYIYQRLRKAAIDSPLTLKELSDVYTTGYPFLARQGVSAEKSIGIANTVASLGKAMGLRLDSIKDDIRAIYEGRFRNVQTFQAAGFTSADFKKLSQLQGDDLVNFFNEKFSGYQDALKRFSGSFIAQWDNMIDSLYQSGALLGEKIAPAFVDFAKTVKEQLGTMATDGTLDTFAKQLKSSVTVVASTLGFLVQSIASTGQGIMSLVTQIVNGAGSIFGAANLADKQHLFTVNANRGIQVLTRQGDTWGPEVQNTIAAMTGQNLGGPDRKAAIVSAMERLRSQKNPAQFVAGYQTDLAQLKEYGRSLELIKYLETGEGLPPLSEMDKGYGHYRNQFGKKRLEAMRELMTIWPDFTPLAGEYDRIQNFGSSSNWFNGFGGAFKEGIINQFDQKKAEIGSKFQDYQYLQLVLDELKSRGYTIPRTKKFIGPVKPGTEGLAGDPTFEKIYEELKNSFAPTPIVQPKIDTKKSTTTKSVSTSIPRDFTPQIQAIASAEAEVNAIKFRLGMNSKRTEADINRAIEDRRLLEAAEIRVERAKAALQKLQATPDNRKTTLIRTNKIVPIDKSGKLPPKNQIPPMNPFGFDETLGSRTTAGNVTTAMTTRGAKADANLPVEISEAQMNAAQDIAEYITLLGRIREEARAKSDEIKLALMELQLDGALNSKDPTVRYNAEKALLRERNKRLFAPGIGGAIYNATHMADVFRYKKDANALDRAYSEEKKQADEEYQQKLDSLHNDVVQERLAKNAKIFQDNMSLRGKFGTDFKLAKLDQTISSWENNVGKGGLIGSLAEKLLPALYAQKQALEDNTTALERVREEKLQSATDAIFSGYGQSGFAETYQNNFNKKLNRIDNMTKSEINKVRAGFGFAGLGMSDDDIKYIKYILKSNAMRGFSHSGYIRAQSQDQATSGIRAAMDAMLNGGDPISALAGSFQNIQGNEAVTRLLGSIFNKGTYRITGADGKTRFNRAGFSNDLISGGGGFLAQYAVNQFLPQNSYASEGSQLGGLAASLGAFSGLGAWAGPVGILAGGLIGSLFGKKKGPDPALEQHRKRLEELLQTISNQLKPQADYFRVYNSRVLLGSESRLFGGRTSVLGARAALGAI